MAAGAADGTGVASNAPWGLGWPWETPARSAGLAALQADPSVVMAPVPPPDDPPPPAIEAVPVPEPAQVQTRSRIYTLPRDLNGQQDEARVTSRIAAEAEIIEPPPTLRPAQ